MLPTIFIVAFLRAIALSVTISEVIVSENDPVKKTETLTNLLPLLFPSKKLNFEIQALPGRKGSLISLGATFNQPEIVQDFNAFGRTLVHQLATKCSSTNVTFTKILPNETFQQAETVKDAFGETPLEIAVKHNCVEMVEIFLSKGMTCTLQNQQGYTPLHLAKRFGFDSLVDSMLNSGKCSLDQEDACGTKVNQINDISPDRCEPLPSVGNGTTILSNETSAFCIGTKLEFNCSAGFVLRFSNWIKCGRNGKWQVQGFCQEPLCNDPPAVKHGKLDFSTSTASLGSTLNFTCKFGYVLRGSNSLKCVSNGNWQFAGFCEKKLWTATEIDSLQAQLVYAAKIGDLAELHKMLQLHILDVNWRQVGGENCRGMPCTRNGTAVIHAASSNPANVSEVVRILIHNGADINVTESSGETALMMAVYRGNLETARLLLDRGADIDGKNNDGLSALMFASHLGHLETVRFLLDRGANIDAKANNGWTPLINAAYWGMTDTVRLLLDRGAKIEAKNNVGFTALMLAANIGRLEIVRLLLQRGANIEATANNGWTSLMNAAYWGVPSTVRLLLSQGAHVNAKSKDGWTGLMLATLNGHLQTVRPLLDRGADVNAKANDGTTAFMLAAATYKGRIVRLLLSRGASREGCDPSIWKLCSTEIRGPQVLELYHAKLRDASKRGDLDKVRELLQIGYLDVNWRSDDDEKCPPYPCVRYMTPLLHATFSNPKNAYEIIRLLIDNGADVDLKEKSGGESALTLAANNAGQLAIVRLLLDRGADVEAKNNYGTTALIKAAYKGHFDIVKLLLDRAADVNTTNDLGETPVMIAAREGDLTILNLLLDRGANINAKNDEGWTALLLSARQNQLAGAPVLINRGADINGKTRRGLTALMEAASYGHLHMVRLLLDRGANIDERDNDGKTALMMAASRDKADTVHLLVSRGASREGCDSSRWDLCKTEVQPQYKTQSETTVRTVAKLDSNEERLVVQFENSLKTRKPAKPDRNGIQHLQVQLREGSKDCNFERVKALLQLGYLDVNWSRNDDENCTVRCIRNATALIHTTNQNCSNAFEIARLLIENEADINVKETYQGNTALLLAAFWGQLEIVRLLLDNGVDISRKDNLGKGALFWAASEDHLDVVRLLLERGADIEAKDNNNQTALIQAAWKGHSRIVRFLLDQGAQINVKMNGGWTALMTATKAGRTDVVRFLLDRGADIEAKNNAGLTAFMQATRDDKIEIAQLLLNRGASRDRCAAVVVDEKAGSGNFDEQFR